MLRGKKVLLGVCGSIAAYKIAVLTRLLIRDGADVRILMTTSAHSFITPLTLATLSKNPVLTSFEKESGEWNNHVESGMWADVFLVAPASANTIGKMANGICDNLLLATYLSARCPVFVAPAMDLDMYQHAAVTNNLNTLRSFGNQIIEATYGELASGLTGTGRMAEPEDMMTVLSGYFKKKSRFQNKNVLITAGPTQELIDPVRFLGNHSTGKMGYALASELAGQGANVTLISGPTNQILSHPSVTVKKVRTAEEMYLATQKNFSGYDIIIMAAAVADYRPETISSEKIKKDIEHLTLELVKTKDIAATLGKKKKKGQLLIGFALETENEIENARKKLVNKNLDLIVLNSLNDAGAGFAFDTNKVTLIDKENNIRHFELKDKKQVASDIADAIVEIM